MTKVKTLNQPAGSQLASPSRRRFGAAGLALASVAGFPLILTPGKARASERLVIVNWGGGVGKAKKEVYYDPFTKETGIPVVPVYGPELAKIKAQVQNKDVEWDIVDLVDSWVAPGEHLGLYEEIDTSIVPMDRISPLARRKFELGTHFYAGVIARSTDRFSEDKRPATWADFWDVEKFPGRRGLRSRIGETLELALMADGVPAESVYPCDIERAFRSLDKLKPHIRQWIAQTPQTTSLIQSNEVDFTYTYVSRVYEGTKSNMAIDFSPEQNLIGRNWQAIVKGTKNKSAAMRFSEFVTRPERQLAFCNITGHAPVANGVAEKINPEIRPWVPKPEAKGNLVLDPDWWYGKEEMLTKRFKEWLMT